MYELIDITNIPRYSFSKLNAWHGCKYEWFLKYIKEIEGIDNALAKYGEFVHALLESHFKANVPMEELAERYQNEFSTILPDGIQIDTGKYKTDLTEKYYNSGLDYLKTFKGFTSSMGKPLYVIESELEFQIVMIDKETKRKFIYKGIIDAIAIDDDMDFYVIDFKSKSKFKNKEELAKYARQLYSYATYVKIKYGIFPKELIFEQFRINNTEYIRFNDTAYLETVRWIHDTVKEIESTKEYPKTCDQFYCNNLCEYRDTCQK